VKARAINVTTDGTTVTLAGTVHSRQERDRALGLARETDRVTKVVDQLVIK
jgi:osmotically-inducible protein OsmY